MNHPAIQTLLKERGGGEFFLRVMDFAGQEDYYHSHHHFLTSRAFYLVVFRLDDPDGINKLDFWLSNLRAHLDKQQNHEEGEGAGPGGGKGEREGGRRREYSIGVVGTHLDLLTPEGRGEEEKGKRREELRRKMEKEGLSLSLYHEVSCLGEGNLEGIDNLREELFRQMLEHSYMGERLPKSYVMARDLLDRERRNEERKSCPLMTLDEMRKSLLLSLLPSVSLPHLLCRPLFLSPINRLTQHQIQATGGSEQVEGGP